MEKTIIEILGWTATTLYLAAYGLNSSKKVESDSFIYQGMNISAGFMMAYYTLQQSAYPAVATNVAWICIGVFSLVNRRRKKSIAAAL